MLSGDACRALVPIWPGRPFSVSTALGQRLSADDGPSFLGPVSMRWSNYFMDAGAVVTTAGVVVSAFLA